MLPGCLDSQAPLSLLRVIQLPLAQVLTKGNHWPMSFSSIADRNLIIQMPLSIVVSRGGYTTLYHWSLWGWAISPPLVLLTSGEFRWRYSLYVHDTAFRARLWTHFLFLFLFFSLLTITGYILFSFTTTWRGTLSIGTLLAAYMVILDFTSALERLKHSWLRVLEMCPWRSSDEIED